MHQAVEAWDRVDNNCGTGAGGFKKGNKCAAGGAVTSKTTLDDDNIDTVRKQIDLPLMRPSVSKSFPNLYQGIIEGKHRTINQELLQLTKSLTEHGFIPDKYNKRTTNVKQSGRGVTKVDLEWTHQSGHAVSVSVYDRTNLSELEVNLYLIPKADREGLIISSSARDASLAVSQDYGTFKTHASNAYELSLFGDKKQAHESHLSSILAHKAEIESLEDNLKTYSNPKRKDIGAQKMMIAIKKRIDEHSKALTEHMIARDWYEEHMTNNRRAVEAWERVDNNCGIGEFGFEKGNKCAAGNKSKAKRKPIVDSLINEQDSIEFDKMMGEMEEHEAVQKAKLADLPPATRLTPTKSTRTFAADAAGTFAGGAIGDVVSAVVKKATGVNPHLSIPGLLIGGSLLQKFLGQTDGDPNAPDTDADLAEHKTKLEALEARAKNPGWLAKGNKAHFEKKQKEYRMKIDAIEAEQARRIRLARKKAGVTNSWSLVSNENCGIGKDGFEQGNKCRKGGGDNWVPVTNDRFGGMEKPSGSNCGIAKGGFQKGNKCAKGDGSTSTQSAKSDPSTLDREGRLNKTMEDTAREHRAKKMGEVGPKKPVKDSSQEGGFNSGEELSDKIGIGKVKSAGRSGESTEHSNIKQFYGDDASEKAAEELQKQSDAASKVGFKVAKVDGSDSSYTLKMGHPEGHTLTLTRSKSAALTSGKEISNSTLDTKVEYVSDPERRTRYKELYDATESVNAAAAATGHHVLKKAVARAQAQVLEKKPEEAHNSFMRIMGLLLDGQVKEAGKETLKAAGKRAIELAKSEASKVISAIKYVLRFLGRMVKSMFTKNSWHPVGDM